MEEAKYKVTISEAAWAIKYYPKAISTFEDWYEDKWVELMLENPSLFIEVIEEKYADRIPTMDWFEFLIENGAKAESVAKIALKQIPWSLAEKIIKRFPQWESYLPLTFVEEED